jgi:hypothetical protein
MKTQQHITRQEERSSCAKAMNYNLRLHFQLLGWEMIDTDIPSTDCTVTHVASKTTVCLQFISIILIRPKNGTALLGQ